MTPSHRFCAVVFDLDGTLVDTLPDIHEALNRALEEASLAPIDTEACRRMIGGGAHNLIEQAFTAIGEPADDPRIDAVFERFLVLYEAEPAVRSRPFDGVIEALDRLRAENVALGVCTNKPHGLTEIVLRELGLDGYFGDSVIGGDALEVRKPAAGHLLEVVRRTGHAASQTLMVGDSETDVASARNAGLPIVAVDFGYTRTQPSQLGADILISAFDQLPAAMSKI